MELFKLFGSIFIDNAKANESLDETDKKGLSVAATFGKGIQIVGQWGAAIVNGAAAAVESMIGAANRFADTADNIDKMSQKLGLSTKGFQEWSFVMSQTGIDINSIEDGMQKLSTRIGEALSGAGAGAELFKQLGIEITESMSQEEVFNSTIAALQGMEDGIGKANLAQELFGSSGQSLLPLINGTAEGVDALKQKALDLGLVLSNDAVNAGVQYSNSVEQLKMSLDTFGNTIALAIMPALQGLIDWVLVNMPEIQIVFSTVFEVIGVVFGTAIEWIITFVESIKTWATDNQEQLENIRLKFSELFEAVSNFISAFIEKGKELWSKYGDEIGDIFQSGWDMIFAIFSTALDVLTDVYNIFASLFKGDWKALWDALKALVSDIITGIYNVFKQWTDFIYSYLKLIGSAISNTWSSIWNGIKTKFEEIWTDVKSFFTDIWEGMVDGVKNNVNLIIGLINKMIGALNSVSFTIPDWAAELMGLEQGATFGFNIPKIPKLAEGGHIVKGGRVLVGEEGPEILDLGPGASVIPLDRSKGIVFDRGAFEGAFILDDYGVDRLMDRIINRMTILGVR